MASQQRARTGLSRASIATEPYGSAAELRHRNAQLDTALARVVACVPEQHLHDEMTSEPWTLALQLAHLGELSGFAAAQLAAWLDGDRAVVGRVPDTDADRNDALHRAAEMRLAPLRTAIATQAAALARVLQRLRDQHLTATVHDVVIGREPLIGYLERYVVAHKQEHLDQLRTTLENEGISGARHG